MRGHTASKNELGTYTFYCRSCGFMMKAKDIPNLCDWCGNVLIDRGFGISGDASASEALNTTYANRDVLLPIDKYVG